jgi:DinB superfamily
MSPSHALDPSLTLRYPIGKFSGSIAEQDKDIAGIAGLPTALRAAVAGLGDAQLDTEYRPSGWTVRQLVHHVADSHMNAYVRVRLALTEDWPAIKPYEEARWSELADARTLPVETSLSLLEPLHRRWVTLLESLGEADWRRGYVHPEMGRQVLSEVIAMYSWHGRHHTAHVTELRKRMGW